MNLKKSNIFSTLLITFDQIFFINKNYKLLI